VWHDLLGLYTDFVPRHARRYAELADAIGQALESYAADVRTSAFPTMKHSSSMGDDELHEALEGLDVTTSASHVSDGR
jgi:3-methyl-2-oxobutanoate hydroxymethyltransferase